MVSLGAGLGFASLTPGRGSEAVEHFAIASVIWLIVTQWISSAIGGYLAGRLRRRWLATHVHEVFFRDTAHGLAVWALATLGVAAFATGTAILRSGSEEASMRDAADSNRLVAYEASRLLLPAGGSVRHEGDAVYVMAEHALEIGSIAPEDGPLLVAALQAQANLSADEARQRVSRFEATAKAFHEKTVAAKQAAREAAAQVGIYTALSMLIGAFIASVAGVIGGRVRDEHA